MGKKAALVFEKLKALELRLESMEKSRREGVGSGTPSLSTSSIPNQPKEGLFVKTNSLAVKRKVSIMLDAAAIDSVSTPG